MARIHPGATLTPHFRDFLPPWVARQPWYLGSGTPSLVPVGYFRLEDPDGEVGIETHLVGDGSVLYQVPMTYRGAPMPADVPGAAEALISTTEHSVLGTRWIYDAVADPVWVGEVLRLVATGGVSDPSGKRGVGPARARGLLLAPRELTADAVTIDLCRVLAPIAPGEEPPGEGGVAGLVTGTWHPDGPDGPVASGRLAVLRVSPAHGHRS